MTKPNAKTTRPAATSRRRNGQTAVASMSRQRRGGRIITAAMVVVIVAFAVAVLYLVYRSSSGATDSTASGSGYPHVAGDPGAGNQAPAFTLTSGDGTPVSLADYRGRTVLLYFQEGLSCQPC